MCNKLCKRCLSEFEPRKGFVNYCSNFCKYGKKPDSVVTVESRVKSLSNTIEKICRFCKKPYEVSVSDKSIFCSEKCSKNAKARAKKIIKASKNKPASQGTTRRKPLGKPNSNTSFNSILIDILEDLELSWTAVSLEDGFTFKGDGPNDVEQVYTPSFYIAQYDVYVEVKREDEFLKDRMKVRLACRQNHVRILTFKPEELDLETVGKKIGIKGIGNLALFLSRQESTINTNI